MAHRTSFLLHSALACLLGPVLADRSAAADLKTTPSGNGQVAPSSPNDRLADQLRQMINHGADLYNRGDPGACYRLFEGSLWTLRPQLADVPRLQKAIDEGLAAADLNPVPGRKAFILRSVLDDIRTHLKEKKTPVAKVEEKRTEKTLWERLGGEDGVKKVVDDLVGFAASDIHVNFTRQGKFPIDEAKAIHLKEQLVAFVSSATGGPITYAGKTMKEIHKGMEITDAEFEALAGHLKRALEKNGAKPADIEAVLKAVEGTRKDIVEVSKKDKTTTPVKPK